MKQNIRLPKRPFAKDGGPIVLAHRGWRGYYPENTMLALDWAAHMPIDGLELDIHSTKDGELVVTHDETVERTTDGQGRVQDYSLAELQKLDAGYWWTADEGKTYPFRGSQLRIPTVEAVFKRFPNLWINIDIKQKTPSIVKPFADLIRDYKMEERMCVGSFENETIRAFRQEIPEVVTAGSANEVRLMFVLNKMWLTGLYRGKGLNFQIPEWEKNLHIVTRSFVEACHRQKTAVHVWTVNEIEDMKRLLDLNVDGLVSDYPDRALALMGRLNESHHLKRATVIIVQDGKVLLFKRVREGNPAYYIVPGGGIEAGETPDQAAIREAKEETNFEVTLGPKLWQKQINPLFEDHGYLVTDFSGDLQLGGPEAERHSENNQYIFEWVPLDEAWHLPLYPSQLDVEAIKTYL
ncbi:MAG: glycerophosphodiester phosphodiesterase family protein [Chloroflexota bacterium]